MELKNALMPKPGLIAHGKTWDNGRLRDIYDVIERIEGKNIITCGGYIVLMENLIRVYK